MIDYFNDGIGDGSGSGYQWVTGHGPVYGYRRGFWFGNEDTDYSYGSGSEHG